MNKLEKILAQSVTSEMVAEHLTEKEIEETINEIEEEKNSVEKYIEFKKEEIEEHKEYIRNNEKLIARSKEEKRRAITRFKQLNRVGKEFQIALRKTKERNGTFRKGYVKLKELVEPNRQRAAVIEEAKSFTKMCESLVGLGGSSVTYEVNEERREVSVILKNFVTQVKVKARCHPNDVWNEHIGKAIAIGRVTGANIFKFKNAPQPTEIVEGMDVELFDGDGELYASGRALKYDSSIDSLCFSEIYRKTTDLQERNYIAYVKRDGFKITGDTKAKYKEEDK